MFVFSRIATYLALRLTADSRVPRDQRITVAARTLAGVVITADNAITVPAVWACLRYLSQTVAVLPWSVMRAGRKGNEKVPGHYVHPLLAQRPNPEWSAFQFRESLTHWALRWGNGYAEIERDPLGRAVALWPIHPSRVTPMRDEFTNALFFRVHNGTLPPSDLQFMDMYHIRGFGEGPIGVNVIEYAAESIGWARAAQLFGAGFFGSGMNVSGVVQAKRSMSETAWRRMKSEFAKLYRGVRGDRVMYLDNDMEFKPIGIEPEKGQFLETNGYLVEEICRWFGVPPHKVMHMARSTNNNVESQVTEVVVDSITPWVKRFEDEADYKLFGANRQGFFTKMNMNALMRGDPASRAAFYQVMREQAIFSANDILSIEDMDQIPAAEGGDKRTMQSQYTTLERIGEDPATSPVPAKIGHNGGPPLDPAEDPAAGDETEKAALAWLAMMAGALEDA